MSLINSYILALCVHKKTAAENTTVCQIAYLKSNFGNIFGGYASKSWKSDGQYIMDKNAFLFLIKCNDEFTQSKCPLLLELKEEDECEAIRGIGRFGPIFGTGYDIKICEDCNRNLDDKSHAANSNFSNQQSYVHHDIPEVNLCGSNIMSFERNLFQVIDYQVFQII